SPPPPPPQNEYFEQDLIPYAVRFRLNQILPELDCHWQENLTEIFKTLSPEAGQAACTQILSRKGIGYNEADGSFTYLPKKRISFSSLATDIPISDLKRLAGHIAERLDVLAQCESPVYIADILESVLSVIKNVDTGGKRARENFKQILKTEFIYAAAEVLKNKTKWEIPENTRNLDSDIICTYICEVFLKSHLLGNSFPMMRPREVKQMPEPVFDKVLFAEQRARQLEVIRTSKYIFAIAPYYTDDIPFSLRRFLSEDKLYTSYNRYYTAIHIPVRNITQNDALRFANGLKQILSLQSGVSWEIIDMMDRIEENYDKKALPLLFSPFPAQVERTQAIAARLDQFERLLGDTVLDPFYYCLTRMAKGEEDLKYIYIAFRQSFGGIFNSFENFRLLPALWMSRDAENMSDRMNAYISAMEDRRREILSIQQGKPEEEFSRKMAGCLTDLENCLEKYLEQFGPVSESIEACTAKLQEQPSFFNRLMKTNDKLNRQIDVLQKQSAAIHNEAYIEMNTLLYRHREVVSVHNRKADYAEKGKERIALFPRGLNGITKLPAAVLLPERPYHFDMKEVLHIFSRIPR
ncbi:hypothetical protein, partial [Neisseria polysaccharea]|uniref:hypothetical protein n=1 Tax=Neisseria polysaccharea TaxID=489 RepID=UPI00272AE696